MTIPLSVSSLNQIARKDEAKLLTPSPVKLLAQRAQIPLLQPLKMKDPGFLHALAGWKPDMIAVAAFGRILPPAILSLPPRRLYQCAWLPSSQISRGWSDSVGHHQWRNGNRNYHHVDG